MAFLRRDAINAPVRTSTDHFEGAAAVSRRFRHDTHTGVKSKGKALIKVVDVSFKYPRNDKVTIEKATVQVSLSSRVACIGPNGAGKSTLIKCLTGEVQPTTGTVWQHPNARIGYIAQHAFHHIEQRVFPSPVFFAPEHPRHIHDAIDAMPSP